MTRAVPALIATLAVVSVASAAAQSRYTSGDGRIRSVQSVTETVTVRAAWPPLASEHARVYFVVTVRFNHAFYLVRASADVVRSMYDLGGGTAIYDDSPLQRRFRDAFTATAHFQVNKASRELPGRLLLGQPADTAML